MGTAVGTKVFVAHGWRASAAVSMGWFGWQLIVLLARGPHCERHTWFGYQGGLEARKKVVMERKKWREENEKTMAQGDSAVGAGADEKPSQAEDNIERSDQRGPEAQGTLEQV